VPDTESIKIIFGKVPRGWSQIYFPTLRVEIYLHNLLFGGLFDKLSGMLVETKYNLFNNLYDSALQRSSWGQVETEEQTPAEKIALKIADLGRRCSTQGSTPELSRARGEVAIATSHFLNDRFGVGAHWDNLPKKVRATVVMELLRR